MSDKKSLGEIAALVVVTPIVIIPAVCIGVSAAIVTTIHDKIKKPKQKSSSMTPVYRSFSEMGERCWTETYDPPKLTVEERIEKHRLNDIQMDLDYNSPPKEKIKLTPFGKCVKFAIDVLDPKEKSYRREPKPSTKKNGFFTIVSESWSEAKDEMKLRKESRNTHPEPQSPSPQTPKKEKTESEIKKEKFLKAEAEALKEEAEALKEMENAKRLVEAAKNEAKKKEEEKERILEEKRKESKAANRLRKIKERAKKTKEEAKLLTESIK